MTRPMKPFMVLLALTAILAGCEDTITPPAATTPEPAATPDPSPAPTVPTERQITCDDSAIRLADRDSGIHGAIIADTLHMGGAKAPVTCQAPANQSLEAGLSMPGDRTAQVQQSLYYLIVIRYPSGNRLYVISRRGDGTSCVVDTNDRCVAQVTGLPDDFDLGDLSPGVPPEIPEGRPAPPNVDDPPPAANGTPPGAASSPQPRDRATGVTVAGPLLTWAAVPRALSYDVYWGTTRDLRGTPINTASTFLSISTSADLAAGTLYYWRVDAKNEAGTTRGNVWSFTTGHPPPATPQPPTFASATASSSGRYAGYTTSPDQALDGDDATMWCATRVPAWFRLDLGEIHSVSWVKVNASSHTVHGNVEISTDGSSWTRVSSFHMTVDERRTFQLDRRIRYVRINFTQTSAPRSHIWQACISDITTSVGTTGKAPPTSATASATASSYGSYGGYTASPDQAIDGDNDTFWCATRVPAWFRWDLGEIRSVSSLNVNVYYHTVHGNVEVSTDGSSWTRVSSFDTTASDTGSSGIENDSERKTFRVDRRIRYVRINFTQTDAPRSHIWKACISEVSTSETGAQPSLSIADDSATEGWTLSFAVTLSAAASRTVTVSYRTSDGTAHSSSDYAAGNGTLRFRAGETRKTISVRTTDDNRNESNETFTVRLHDASGATISDDSATGTIINDDGSTGSGTAVASSYGSYAGYTASPDQAIDGDNDTFWCATRVPAWFRWDLGEIRSASSRLDVDVYYHTVHGSIETSTDGSSWTRLITFDTTASDTGSSGIESDSERKSYLILRSFRYVRINFTQTDAPRSHIWKACISEVSAS